MKLLVTVLTLILTVGCLYAQVSNVRVQQRTDGSLMVDIYYDFSNPQGYDTEIAVVASGDNGATWELACSSSNQTGDVGEDISAGTDKHIVWDFYADNPNTSGSQFKVRVLYYFYDTMTDYDGNVYPTVKIGNQWWMAENLKVTHYKDGAIIPYVWDKNDWIRLQFDDGTGIGAYCYYDNDINNVSTYGLLYNWYAVAHSRGLAPDGWHVPTDAEWRTLETTLGASSVAGSKLAGRADLWKDGDLENNANFGASGFSALPGGFRVYDDGTFHSGKGYCAYFWSSSSYSSKFAWFRGLDYNYSDVYRDHVNKNNALLVRLVRD